MNREFIFYKNKHKDKTAILFASGPTLELYNFDSSKDWVRVGVNSVIYKEDLKLDYFFGGQNVRRESWNHPHHDLEIKSPIFNQLDKRKDEMEIFLLNKIVYDIQNKPTWVDKANDELFTNEEIQMLGAISFECHTERGVSAFQIDINTNPLYDRRIVFPALQFLLYTGVKEIYLVGCDCGYGASYLEPNKRWDHDIKNKTEGTISFWKEFKEFVDINFKDVKIISINPKGLKGMFQDVYE
jgi:hypothetical protein